MPPKFAEVRRGKDSLLPKHLESHEASINSRSITPTTHLYRDIIDDEDIYYQDVYQHATWRGEVLHFGINNLNPILKTAIQEHNARQAERIASSEAKDVSNASSKTEEYGKFVKQVLLTDYETVVMQSA